MFEVSATGQFRAAHRLRLPDGSVEPPHEHNWRVTVTFAGPRLNEVDLLVDFTDIRSRLAALLADLDGCDLNALPAFASRNPSAERLAAYVADHLAIELPDSVRLRWVEVVEAPGCVARYSPE
jgi:6-pyruvoyltetrahydropterin/6-carboxytetrahydropterin synthase